MTALPKPQHCDVPQLLRFAPVWLVVVLAAGLNLWGLQWGLFNRWHADELTELTESMLRSDSIDPHYSMYGNIAFYGTALGVAPAMVYTATIDPPPVPSTGPAHDAWQERYDHRIALWPRVTSVIEGLLLVLVTYVIGCLLFDRMVGLLGAFALATTPVTVYIHHVATADGLANLLFWLACLAAVYSWRCGGQRPLALSILLAGMAAGAKTDHVLVVVLVALAYAWREQKHPRDAVLFLLLPVGYAAANPLLVLRPFAFVDGLTRDMFFGSTMDTGRSNSWAILLRQLWLDIGWPVGLVAIGALVYAVLQIGKGRDRRELSWILTSFVPYCLITGSKNVSPWYLGQLMPGLVLLAAYGATRVPQTLSPRPRVIARGALALLYGLALLGPISLDLQFTHDPRDAATRWIETHVPAGATIFVSERAPKLSTRYRVETLIADRERWTESEFPVARLDRHPLYQRIRRAILAAERWSGATFHTPVRDEPYRGWYDIVLARLHARPAATPRVMQMQPDFVVVVQGMAPTLLAWLRTPASGYVQVGSFAYRSPVRPNLRMPMVNQRSWIFQRRTPKPAPILSAA